MMDVWKIGWYIPFVRDVLARRKARADALRHDAWLSALPVMTVGPEESQKLLESVDFYTVCMYERSTIPMLPGEIGVYNHDGKTSRVCLTAEQTV